MASAWRAPAAATRAGRAPAVTRGHATRAVRSMAPARTANASAAQDGTESTAPSVGEAGGGGDRA